MGRKGLISTSLSHPYNQNPTTGKENAALVWLIAWLGMLLVQHLGTTYLSGTVTMGNEWDAILRCSKPKLWANDSSKNCNSYQRRKYILGYNVSDTWKKAEDYMVILELAKESPAGISKQESTRSSLYLPKKSTNQASTQIASPSTILKKTWYLREKNLVFRKNTKGCLENDFCQHLSMT